MVEYISTFLSIGNEKLIQSYCELVIDMERCCENCDNWEREPYYDEYFKIMDEHCYCNHPDSDDFRFKCDSSNNYSWFEPKDDKDVKRN